MLWEERRTVHLVRQHDPVVHRLGQRQRPLAILLVASLDAMIGAGKDDVGGAARPMPALLQQAQQRCAGQRAVPTASVSQGYG